MEVNLPFLLCFTLYLRTISKSKAYIWRGDLTEGFLLYEFGGLIFGGLIHGGVYFRNFTVLTAGFIARTEEKPGVCKKLKSKSKICTA